jgi:hemerythrin-like domain-containing protein
MAALPFCGFGRQFASNFFVRSGADLAHIRSRYIAHALRRVRTMVAGREKSARRAAEELRSYFEWIKEYLPAEDRHRFCNEIKNLMNARVHGFR